MNFFAHALPWLDDPWFVAGTCLPDWMSVINRRVRLRKKKIELRIEDSDLVLVRVAQGVLQHHADDDWFHDTAEFTQLNLEFSVQLREQVQLSDSLRTRFVGHILIEMLLDDWLRDAYPGRLDSFYRLLEELPSAELERVVVDLAGERVANQATLPVQHFLSRFRQERFLYDYQDDERLLFRLNQVMRRVKLPELPSAMLSWLPQARKDVGSQAMKLLVGYRWPDPVMV